MDDLISRAAAIARIDKCVPLSGIGLEPVMAVRDVKALISVLPAVDAAPVVHARWKSVKAVGGPGYPYWDAKCSECGYTTAMTQTGWLYCPHCGAKMDGEAHEHAETAEG